MTARTWMAVERLGNWYVDQEQGFTQFGIPDHLTKRISEAEVEDYVIFYVSSGVSSFADIRKITSTKIERLGVAGRYDEAFPHSIATESVMFLEREKWVSIKPLLPSLQFTKDLMDWRQTMRNAFRLLGNADAKLIVQHMEKAHG